MDTPGLGGVDFDAYRNYVSVEEESSDLLDRDVFLELLVTQLQYQDPLDPMDNQEFTGQLAQLTQVEQLRAANTNLESLQLYEMSINNAQSVGMIGRMVKAGGDAFNYEGETTKLSYNLADDAKAVTISIFDSSGDQVKTIVQENCDKGVNKFSWNGLDKNNSPVEDGEYTFTVSATDALGDAVGAVTLITGKVDGVMFEGGVPILTIDGQKVNIGDIYEVVGEE